MRCGFRLGCGVVLFGLWSLGFSPLGSGFTAAWDLELLKNPDLKPCLGLNPKDFSAKKA